MNHDKRKTCYKNTVMKAGTIFQPCEAVHDVGIFPRSNQYRAR